MLPTTARVTQEFGANFLVNGQWAYPSGGHNGMDFGASYAPIVAPYPGIVEFVGWDGSGFGNLIIIRDSLGYRHWLAHLSSFLVSKGQAVGFGQTVGISGNTGFSTAPHLHWGVQWPGNSGYNGFGNPRNWQGFNAQGVAVNPEQLKLLQRWQAFGPFFIYAGLLMREIDPTAAKVRAGQDPEVIMNDIFGSKEYAAIAAKYGLVDAGNRRLITSNEVNKKPLPEGNSNALLDKIIAFVTSLKK